jgi:predicted hotdog family 3-hydroxylacyl-ACP dehydratase
MISGNYNEVMQQEDIETFIPQRHPFVMLDALRFADEKISRGVLIVKEDNIFVKNGVFTEPGLIEHMAQTAAAGIGYLCNQENKPVPIGYLGAVEKLAIRYLPGIGEEIVTEIVLENQIFDASVIAATILSEEKVVATCKMKIFIKRKP